MTVVTDGVAMSDLGSNGSVADATIGYSEDVPGYVFRALGWCVVFFGAASVGFAVYAIDTSVPTDSLYGGSGRINNMGLLQTQMICVLCGLTVAIVGAIIAAVGHVVGALARYGKGAP